MGLFDSLLNNFNDGEAEKLVGAFLDQHGGIDGIAAQFEKQGLGGTVESWMGDVSSQTITADQIHQVFGAGGLRALATLTGMSTQDLAQKLADHLPGVVAQRQGGATAKSSDDADTEDADSDDRNSGGDDDSDSTDQDDDGSSS